MDIPNPEDGFAGWRQALSFAIEHGGISDPLTRLSIAQQNTWDQRVDLLETWYSEMLAGKTNITP